MPAEQTTVALFDRRAWRAHRARAARLSGSGLAVDFLHGEVAARLIDRLDVVNRSFADVLDLGARDGALSDALAARPGTRSVVAAEPAWGFMQPSPAPRARGNRPRQRTVGEGETGQDAAHPRTPTLSPEGGEGERLGEAAVAAVAADPELLPFRDGRFDLAISNLVLHWCADLPGALVQLRRALKPDGLLLAALFGGETLVELRTALFEAELAEEGGVSPRVSPSIGLADAAALLQRAGFALPVADSERITVTYPDLPALLRDLRGMGETNALAARRGFLRRTTLARAALNYAERFGDTAGRLPATFEVVFLCGWAPHPSQPRPLPRGSATARLADALRSKS